MNSFLAEWNNSSPLLHVHTSGSTGKPKDLLVEKRRMLASAQMTCDFLHLSPGDTALLCMPLDYIAGKMMVVRSIERGLKLISVTPSSHPLDSVDEHINFAAFVPLQVAKSIDDPKLKEIDNIIIGGGAIDRALEERLRSFPNSIYSSYGMTETLSHIALRRLSGQSASMWYTPLPNVNVSLSEDSCLVIDAPLLCAETLTTNDIAELNAEGQFRILGRKDNVINSGGVKIQIEEVERLISNAVQAQDNALVFDSDAMFQITSAPDSTFGEIVVMLIPSCVSAAEESLLMAAAKQLPKYWQPKRVVRVDELPRTETGKPKRDRAREMAKGEAL